VAFRRYLNKAYTWDLWGAAYLINGGCSDDGFEYFRRWLVSRGATSMRLRLPIATVWRTWIRAPGAFGSSRRFIVAVAVFKKGGEGDVPDHSEPVAGMGGLGPIGEPFTEDEEQFARRYPKLWQRFGI